MEHNESTEDKVADSGAEIEHKRPRLVPYNPRKPTARSAVSNGEKILPGMKDGRTKISRRYRDIVSQICVDSGGPDKVSETKLQLIRRFAAAAVMAEALEARLVNGERIDVLEHAQLSSTLVRLVSRIGINRIPKDLTTLNDVLRLDLEAREEREERELDGEIIDG
jgi:hypothetical protein